MAALNKAVLSYGGTMVKQADLDTLEEGEWLSDQVISFYLEYLGDQTGPSPAVACLDASTAFLLTHEGVTRSPDAQQQYRQFLTGSQCADPSVSSMLLEPLQAGAAADGAARQGRRAV